MPNSNSTSYHVEEEPLTGSATPKSLSIYFILITLNTYPNSSLRSFLVASKGTFRTNILELFCFVAVAVLRCDTLSLKV